MLRWRRRRWTRRCVLRWEGTSPRTRSRTTSPNKFPNRRHRKCGPPRVHHQPSTDKAAPWEMWVRYLRSSHTDASSYYPTSIHAIRNNRRVKSSNRLICKTLLYTCFWPMLSCVVTCPCVVISSQFDGHVRLMQYLNINHPTTHS